MDMKHQKNIKNAQSWSDGEWEFGGSKQSQKSPLQSARIFRSRAVLGERLLIKKKS